MKKLISLLMVTILLIGIMPTVAFASESVLFLSEELNETQLSPNAPAAIETPEERHNRLIAEGYELVSSSKGRQTRA